MSRSNAGSLSMDMEKVRAKLAASICRVSPARSAWLRVFMRGVRVAERRKQSTTVLACPSAVFRVGQFSLASSHTLHPSYTYGFLELYELARGLYRQGRLRSLLAGAITIDALP